MSKKSKSKKPAEASPKVTVINRTRAEITVGEGTTLPGTPRHSFRPKTTVFDLDEWKEIEKSKAVKGMIALGQIEVH